MKKTFFAILAVLALVCMVSCTPEPGVQNHGQIKFDGKTYDYDYVYTSYMTGEGVELVFSQSYDLRYKGSYLDNLDGVHFEFEVPIEKINSTLVYGVDDFDGSNWDFYANVFGVEGASSTYYPSEGTVCSMTTTVVDNKVTNLSFSYQGKINDKDFSVSFSGVPDFSTTDVWFY